MPPPALRARCDGPAPIDAVSRERRGNHMRAAASGLQASGPTPLPNRRAPPMAGCDADFCFFFHHVERVHRGRPLASWRASLSAGGTEAWTELRAGGGGSQQAAAEVHAGRMTAFLHLHATSPSTRPRRQFSPRPPGLDAAGLPEPRRDWPPRLASAHARISPRMRQQPAVAVAATASQAPTPRSRHNGQRTGRGHHRAVCPLRGRRLP